MVALAFDATKIKPLDAETAAANEPPPMPAWMQPRRPAVEAPAPEDHDPAAEAIGWTSGDALSLTCPKCGADAEYPDCEACGHVFGSEAEGQGEQRASLQIAFTIWKDVKGESREQHTRTWPELCELLSKELPSQTKAQCRLVKLSIFGDQRTDKGSLRHDANVLTVTGVEGDYDAGAVTLDEAIARLERHQIKAYLYESWSSTTEHPRWRVLAPLTAPVAPDARLRLVEALNGALGGILATESKTLSQSFYFGHPVNQHRRIGHTFDNPDEGFCLDQLDDLELLRQPFGSGSKTPSDQPKQGADDWLAKLLTGDDVHGNALRIIGKMVWQGVDDATIKATFKVLAEKVRDLRGNERAAELVGSELQRMIDGARSKDYAPFAGPKVDFSALLKTPEGNQQAPIYTMVGDLIANPKPPSWQIEDFLEADSLALLYGPPKKGKSFIAIDWICSIATGTPWHGHPTTRSPVFYICGEGHNGLSRRFIAWSQTRGVSLADAPIAVSNKSILLTDPNAALAAQSAVMQLAEQTQAEPGIIVVDTLARNFGANENDSRDMSQFIGHLDAIRAGFKATVLVVHHSGKDEAKGARGSTALFGAIDAAYSVTQDELGMVNLRPEAMKDADTPSVKVFKLEVVTLPFCDERDRPVTSCCPALLGFEYAPPQRGKQGRGKNQTKALMHLDRLYDEHRARVEADDRDPDEARVYVTDWRAACIADGIPANRWPEVLRSLQDGELCRVEGHYVLQP